MCCGNSTVKMSIVVLANWSVTGKVLRHTTQADRRTFASVLHMLQFIWKPQNFRVALFTLLSQEMKKCCILTDRFSVSELKKMEKKIHRCLESFTWGKQCPFIFSVKVHVVKPKVFLKNPQYQALFSLKISDCYKFLSMVFSLIQVWNICGLICLLP